MKLKLKYVIVDSMGLEVPRFCSHLEQHGDLIKLDEKVISAGFCKISQDDVYCYGQSVGLKRISRPAIDAKLIKTILSTETIF